jgi:drug/metabolite transporter (DMT)-like permease
MQPAARRPGLSFEPTYATLTLTTLLWSSNFVIGRALHAEVSPAAMNFLRWAIALCILVPFTLRDLREHRVALLQHWKLIALLGLTGIAAFQTLGYVALAHTSALNTVLLLALAPLAIFALSWLALGERVSRRQVLGLAISLVGALVLILRGDLAALLALHLNLGDVSMLLAVALWAVYSVLLRRRPAALPPLALHTASVAAGTLWMVPVFAIQVAWQPAAAHALPTSATAWAGIAFVGVFSSALAHGLWVRGVATIGPNRASVFIHLMPVFGTLLAVTLLGETVGGYHLAGAALTMLGILLTARA